MTSSLKTEQTEQTGKTDKLLWTLLGIAFLACYYTTFLWFNFKFSQADTYYSHGYLIPFISGYLIYRKKDELTKLSINSCSWGLGLIFFALFLRIFGVLINVNFFSGFSLVFYIFGCSIYLLGKQITKEIFFPLLFLLFMCPISSSYLDQVGLPLKSGATWLALHGLDLFGISYFQEGFTVNFASSTMVVGTPCNGLRSLITFFALGFLFLYLIPLPWWKKGIFLCIIPPVSILLNGVRIFILLFIGYKYGTDAASPESYMHDTSGLVVFGVGLVFFIFLINRMSKKNAA